MENIIFWAIIIIATWLGVVRNIITIILNFSQEGKLKSGQKLCHLTSLLIYACALFLTIKNQIIYPLIIGIILEYVFRMAVIKSGNIVNKK